MIIIAALALAAQITPPRQTVVKDSTRPDSTTISRRRPQPIRRAVTPELRASAYKDVASRDLIEKARVARVSQDAAITGYDAKVAQRLSVKAAIGSVTMERLAYRQEATARVQWQRGVGAHIDVTGSRVTIPLLGMPKAERDALEGVAADPSLIPLPYFPGQEPLWVGQFAARPDVNENTTINPLANGAEAYYTYQSSDVTKIRLSDGDSIVVRQIDVRPRFSGSNMLVGSLWLDDLTGQVVRAGYRFASPGRAAVSVTGDSGGKKTGAIVATVILKTVIPTMIAEVTDIVVEYQRVQGFWLPRSQVMEGYVKSSFAKVPVTIENAFRFESVNETANLASFTVDTMSTRTRTVDSVKVGSLDQCKTSSSRVVTAYKGDSVPVQLRVSCNLDSLMNSPDLPASPFDKGEEIFGTAQRDEIIAQALTLGRQSPFSFVSKPDFAYGVSFTRYNRIEGLSTGIQLTQQMGAGFDFQALGRVATADHRPRFEGSIGRSNGSRSIRVGGFDRLVPMTDWETPLSFGSSLSALLFGRDDAFYYRSAGAEVLTATERGRAITWRGFVERQTTAYQKTDFSVGGTFVPNLPATDGWYGGLATRYHASRGLNPRGFRMSSDIRAEAVAPIDPADTSRSQLFGRGSLEVTVTKGLSRAFDAALTLSGGSSVGDVPVQRLYYLGGTQTIRGQDPSPLLAGNAYWLGRGELARPLGVMRLSAFGDFGWAGDRDHIGDIVRPASGAGLGFSFLDGTARFDIARGIYPAKQTRVAFYLGSRF